MENTEYIGYVASVIVLLSFLMRKIFFLRIVNTVGCIFFIVYGMMLGSIPIILTNTAIALINGYYLTKSDKQTSLD
jgi:hypothetical protein